MREAFRKHAELSDSFPLERCGNVTSKAGFIGLVVIKPAGKFFQHYIPAVNEDYTMGTEFGSQCTEDEYHQLQLRSEISRRLWSQ